MRPDVKDPVQVSADDGRLLCANCKKQTAALWNDLCDTCADEALEDIF